VSDAINGLSGRNPTKQGVLSVPLRATLFHNPSAGHRADKDDILAAMKLADFDVRYVSTKQDDIEQALEKKTDLFVIAGGDGTITEITTKLPDRSIPVDDRSPPLDVGMVKASCGTSRFIEGFGVGLFAEFLKAADKHEKGKGADNLRKGRALLEKWVKTAKPIEISIKIDGKAFNGEFLGVEVMNVPFTGPALP
jgi:diacylglycerol kinase (ATP)